jgi:hypothetical protein
VAPGEVATGVVVAAAVDGAVVAAGEHAPTMSTTTAAKTAIVDGFFPIDFSSNRSIGSDQYGGD